jgi:cyclomaltodextrin glucanotransferase
MSDFRGETIYFIVVDRFCDGNPGNNHGKERDYDASRTDWYKYWGGDLHGVLDKLDYVANLGATAIWLTPLFDQVDHLVPIGPHQMAPYHGYWAKDFKRIDEHLVDDPADVRVFATTDSVLDRLVAAMHHRGMKLVLDIVCNHSSPHQGGGRGQLFDDGKLVASFADDKGGWFHHHGEVRNWNDLAEVQSRELCGLCDFDEESHAFRSYIKSAMKSWLDKGVDAFRIDTVKHMPLWFWQEFIGDMQVHKPELFVFGEWFQGGCWDPASVELANKSDMAILDFAWRNAVVGALAHRSARGFRDVADVVDRDHLFVDATELVTFVDNHDLPRFLSLSNDRPRFRLATLLTMVARGIPCLYYGGEQFLHDDQGGGNDPYNRPWMSTFEANDFGRDIARLAELRRRSPAVQKAGMRTKWLDEDRWVFSRKYQDAACVVGANRGDAPTELVVEGLELPDGEHADVLGGPPLRVQQGRALVRIGPRDIAVHSHLGASPHGKTLVDLQVHGIGTAPGEDLYVCGDAPELGGWDVSKAVRLEYVDRASWAGTVAFDASTGRDIHYKFLLRRGPSFVREPGLGHHRRVPETAHAIWRDRWRP